MRRRVHATYGGLIRLGHERTKRTWRQLSGFVDVTANVEVGAQFLASGKDADLASCRQLATCRLQPNDGVAVTESALRF